MVLLISTILAFDNRTRSTREIWRQLQATRYHNANPNLSINTHVLGTAGPPEVVFKFIDDTEVRVIIMVKHPFFRLPDSSVFFQNNHQKRFDSQHLKANEIMFDVHLDLDRLDNEYEMSGKSLDE